MKLLDSEKKELAVLDETTSRVVNWGGTPAFIYYTGTFSKGTWTDQKMFVYKLEALAGFYLETDAGTQVQFPTDKTNVKAIAEFLKEYGLNTGSTIFGSSIKKTAVKTYADLDKNLKGLITITVHVNAPEGTTDVPATLTLSYPRSVNAVTVNDVLASDEIPTIDGYSIAGATLGTATDEASIVKGTDKLLEDQEITLVWGKAVAVNFVKYVKYADGTAFVATEKTADVTVAYGSKISAAVTKAAESITADEGETYEGVAFVSTIDTDLTNKQLKKTVNTIADGEKIAVKYTSTANAPTTTSTTTGDTDSGDTGSSSTGD